MRTNGRIRLAWAIALSSLGIALPAGAEDASNRMGDPKPAAVQVGPRPYYLIGEMSPSPLKHTLEGCREGPFRKTGFSIGHRGGAALQFPEHTKESFVAGARMGAGLLECDVTFTRDAGLVCRHDQCDLHTTTNILVTPLAQKCSEPFSPATFDARGERTKAASALCCTSDLTLAEFSTLAGKMDAFDPDARTPAGFLAGGARWRTDLYATGATVLTHRESIALIEELGAKFIPELKGPNRKARVQVEEVFGSRANYAQAMIDEYEAAGVSPGDVWPQSFDADDVRHWIAPEPAFGRQAVLLLSPHTPADVPDAAELQRLAGEGIRIIAPPMWVLLAIDDSDDSGAIAPSQFAKDAKAAGLDVLTWTLERSGRIEQDVLPTKGTSAPSYYYQSTLDALTGDGDVMTTLDVLARQVGVRGVFSDWSGTVSYYASCLGMR